MRVREFMRFWTASFALVFSSGLFVSAEPLPVNVPPAEKVLSGLKKTHPRLIATGETFSETRELVKRNKLAARWKQKLESRAGSILRQSPSKYRIPDGLRLLGTSRRVLDRVYTLALMYRLEKEKRYAERAWLELEAASEFKDWNPRHFLDTSEMSHAFAIGYDWLFDVWDAKQRKVIREALIEKGLNQALKSYRGEAGFGWWVRSHHNWNQVCNGGIAMGALAIADEKPELSANILKYALESFKRPCRRFAPDGAWAEGPGYWRYATSYHVYLLASLESALGTDFGFLDVPGFDKTGFFPIDMTGPGGRTFNFADASPHTVRAPHLFYLAKRYDEPLFAWYQRKVARPHPLDLIWFDARGKDPRSMDRPLAGYYRGTEVASLRSAWGDPDAIFLAFKAGDNRVNHSHLDIGTFVFEAEGERWAVDLGADNYNLPAYFGGRRWDYYRLRTEGHNTLVIDPEKRAAQDPKAVTHIVKFSDKPERMFAVADISDAYEDEASKVLRGVALNGNQALIQDEITAKENCKVFWFMHTRSDVALQGENKRTARLSQGGKKLIARIVEPKGAGFSVMKASPLPASPDPKGQARNRGVRKLTVSMEGKKLRLAVLLCPGGEEAEEAGWISNIVPLKKW